MRGADLLIQSLLTAGVSRIFTLSGNQIMSLVLVHIGPHLSGHGPMEKSIGDIREVYDGQVLFSDELMSFDVTR